MPEDIKEPPWFRNFKGIACGTTAGIAVTIVGHPLDTIKTRLQTQSHTAPIYNGAIDCMTKTIKWEGLNGFYKGIFSPLAGQIFLRTCLFTSYYESIHQLQKSLPKGQKLGDREYLIAGLITGGVVAFSDSPMELFKSKMQYQIISEKLDKPLTVRYNGVIHCLRYVISNYGIRGVYQGLGPTFIRDVIGYGIYFCSFEKLKLLSTPKGQRVEDLSRLKFIVCAGIAGCIYWILNFNIDVVKSAMMADEADPTKRRYKSMLDCASQLYKNEGGYSRFWRGFTPCFIRAFIISGLMLYVVDVTRKYFPSYQSFKR